MKKIICMFLTLLLSVCIVGCSQTSLSMRKLYDERGNVYFGVDEEIRERLQAKLMRAILTFRAE